MKRALTITESSMGTDHPNSKRIREVILEYQQEAIELNWWQWILSESFTFVLRLTFIQIDDQKRTINPKWWQTIIVIICLPFILIFNLIRWLNKYFCGKYFRS
nr:hypothetical protein [Nostoc sp. PCC 7107]